MILRRFMKHVTDQNWFAVGLDVLVVITGIFLGMQVTEWNEARQDRQLEIEYLERIKVDLQRDSDRLEVIYTSATESLAQADFLLAALEDESLLLERPTGFARTVREVAWSSFFDPAATTWNELNTSGRLILISFAPLRDELAKHYEYTFSQWSDIFREMSLAYRLEMTGILPVYVEKAIRGLPEELKELVVTPEDALKIRDAWKARPRLRDFLMQQISMHSMRRDMAHKEGLLSKRIDSLVIAIDEHLVNLKGVSLPLPFADL